MSSDKKRDVAKEFVDFLLAEENKKPDESTTTDRTKKTEEARTAVLDHSSPYERHSSQTGSYIHGTKPSIVSTKPNMSPERSRQIFNEVSQLVSGTEAVRVAQARIKELERERDELRSQIDSLLLDCETLQKQSGELKTQVERTEKKQKESFEIMEEEKVVLTERLKSREKELSEIKRKNDEMNSRFQNDLQKIRVREKEYENKNILLKAETTALSKMKDDMILDLKRKIDQFQLEMDNYKTKFSHSEIAMQEMRDRQVRSIKALRLALSILESDELEENTLVRASGDE